MKEEIKRALACYKVIDLPRPNPAALRGRYCENCKAEVYIMPENTTLALKILCHSCCRKLSENDTVTYFSASKAREQ